MAEWATTTDADTYLAEKPGTSAWNETGLDQQAYLTTAYRAIFYDPDYTIPTTLTAAQTTLLQYAQIELAFYILQNPNHERRQNLINQGVTSTRIGQFSESYESNKGRDTEGFTTYPVIVANFLRPFLAVPTLYTNVTRNQENIV